MSGTFNIPLAVDGDENISLTADGGEPIHLDVDTDIRGGGGGGAVNSVNGKTGNVVLDASDVGALPDTTPIPSKTSDLTNDSGFVDAAGAMDAVIYNATYGTTTNAEIEAAYQAGKVIICQYNDVVYRLTGRLNNGSRYVFIAGGTNLTVSAYLMCFNNSWSSGSNTLSLPTKTSDLTNDSGFVNAAGAASAAPVQSVNGQTGAVVLSIPSSASDVGAEPAVTEVTVSTAGAVTQALDAGKIYHFTGAVSALTLTLNAASGVAQYHFDFTSGSTATTLTLPSGVTMPDSFAVEANKHYEVDILNGYGAVMAWATS